jgi:hypothetical protein
MLVHGTPKLLRPQRGKIAALYLIKFFNEDSHAIQFIAGDLFMRRLSYFKRLEDAEGRGDPNEALFAWLQPRGLKMNFEIPGFGKSEITESDLAAPVSLGFHDHNFLYVYCMYCVYSQWFDGIQLSDMEKEIEIDRRCLKFGPYAVIVPVRPFVDRLKKAKENQALRLASGLVEYYDEAIFNGEFSKDDAPFRKQKIFSYQREYRICLETLTRDDVPRTVNIGSLSDIAHRIPSELLPGSIKLGLP